MLFYRQVGFLREEFSPVELLLGLTCLLLAVLTLARPFAFDARTDAPAIIVCGLCKSYYWLFDYNAEGGEMSDLLGSGLMSAGVICWMWSLLWLGRNFSILPALREVQVNGPYKYLRHPIYFSYILVDVGLVCSFPSLWNLAVACVGVSLYVVRVYMEEELLSRNATYQEYRRRTKYRLIPPAF